MAATSRLLSSAVVGSLLVVTSATSVRAQLASRLSTPPPVRVSSFAAGSLQGVVRDERGDVVEGAVVSALGATTTIVVTDKNGRYDFGVLPPGPYLVRGHLAGFIAPRAKTVQVSSSARASLDISFRRSAVLAAAIGLPGFEASVDAIDEPEDAPTTTDSETAWRIRHARRSILKDTTISGEWLVDANSPIRANGDGWTADVFGRAVDSARAASNFFTDTVFSGQLNLLTSGSFDSPDQLVGPDYVPNNVAYVSLSAPIGDQADWAVRGGVTQADLTSWSLAGAYATRAPARHRYDLGWSYATQRYDGGNPLTLRDIPAGSRNAGNVYAYDSFAVNPGLTLTYGTAFARYDYLSDRSLLSPRVEVSLSPAEQFRVNVALSRRALAPGAEEFVAPSDTGLWAPPQRTFSSLRRDGSFDAERTTNFEASVERDFGKSTLTARAFRQHVDGQLLTLFGVELPDAPSADVGHYIVGSAGDADARGYAVGLRTLIASRVRASAEYAMTSAQLTPRSGTLLLLVTSSVRSSPEQLHGLSTSVETEVPETATRILVLYKLSNGFAQPSRGTGSSPAALGSRFDVQVRQQLPFMNFSSARWEMLLAVRNFFRENGMEQSVYDELLVVRPPKRFVGGVALRF